MKYFRKIFHAVRIVLQMRSVLIMANPILLTEVEAWLERKNQFTPLNNHPAGVRIYKHGFVEIRIMKSGYLLIGIEGNMDAKFISSPLDKKEILGWIDYFKSFKQ